MSFNICQEAKMMTACWLPTPFYRGGGACSLVIYLFYVVALQFVKLNLAANMTTTKRWEQKRYLPKDSMHASIFFINFMLHGSSIHVRCSLFKLHLTFISYICSKDSFSLCCHGTIAYPTWTAPSFRIQGRTYQKKYPRREFKSFVQNQLRTLILS
jgi:hypothetical protein